MSAKPTNLVPYMNRFDAKEKAALCNYLRAEGGQDHMHVGLLPFTNIRLVVSALRIATNKQGTASRANLAKRLLSKMPEAWEQGVVGYVSFLMQLDVIKVHRHFGSNPERGKPLNFLPKEKVTVGKKWSMAKKAYIDDKDVLVAPCVTLKRKGLAGERARCLWEVTVLKRCRYAVEMWLLEKCS